MMAIRLRPHRAEIVAPTQGDELVPIERYLPKPTMSRLSPGEPAGEA
jgi:hypothetical protein